MKDMSKMSNVILGRSSTTMPVVDIPSAEIEKDAYVHHLKGAPANRLIRTFGINEEYTEEIIELPFKDGIKEVMIQKPKFTLEGDPIVYIDFRAEPSGKKRDNLHELSKTMIRKGVKIGGLEYEYVMSSASQLRQLKGVFVRKDYVMPIEDLDKFSGYSFEYRGESVDASLYKEYLSTLSGAELILELSTYGAYSGKYSDKLAHFLNGVGFNFEISNKKFVPSKFMARTGLALTSSIPFGNDWNVKHIGEVRYDLSDYVLEGIDESEVPHTKKHWKSTKLDGQNMVRLSKVKDIFMEEYEKEIAPRYILGKLLQFRWAGVKGTALVVDDAVLDMCKDKDGNPVYKGYDLIVEDNSWKYSPMTVYSGENAPMFELVSISKGIISNRMNYQFIEALDGIGLNRIEDTVKVLKEIVDENITNIRRCLDDPAYSMVKLGIEESPSPIADFDSHSNSIKTKIGEAIYLNNEIIYDAYYRKKILSNFRGKKDDFHMGKIEVEGGVRYVISDPSAMLRTDLMDEDGNIVITDPEQVALRGIRHGFWDKKNKQVAVFRSPCIHPGEPQKVDLVDKPHDVHTPFGVISAEKLFGPISDVFIVSGFNNILEALGGADTDGDTVLVVEDERIINLISPKRKSLFVDIGDKSKMDVINIDTIKDNMIFSLKDNGIGLVTNYATTWRDIEQHVLSGSSLPEVIVKDLKKSIEDAQGKNEIIANMDINSGRSIVTACEEALEILRMLQEKAINTAKSGVFINFDEYNFLQMKTRPSWLKRTDNSYDSNSVMGYLRRYIDKEWTNLQQYAYSTAEMLAIFPDVQLREEARVAVESIQKSWSQDIMEIMNKHDDDAFGIRFEKACTKAYLQLSVLASEYGVKQIAACAYTASQSNIQIRKDQIQGGAFIWNCFFDEFKAALSSEESFKLHKALIAKGQEGEVAVYGHQIYNVYGIMIGRTTAPNGDYEVKEIDGKYYIQSRVERNTVDLDELEVNFSGKALGIVGFKYHKDFIDGNELTKERTKELIEDDNYGNHLLMVKYTHDPMDPSSKGRFSVLIRKDIQEGKVIWHEVGSIQNSSRVSDKNYARVLKDRIIKVDIHPDYATEPESILTVVIDSVLY